MIEKLKAIVCRDKKKIALSVLLFLLPFIIVCFDSLVFNKGIHLRSFIPANINDEYSWYLQIESIVKFNKPLGYYGFNEYHSQIGNLSGWPILTYVPYVIVGKIIGWNNYTMVLVNIGLISISLLMFILIAKPTRKGILSAIIMYLLCCLTTHYYTTLSMTEACRCSFGIVMVSIIIYLSNNRLENVSFSLAIIIILFSIMSIMVFYPFIVFMFIIVFLLLKNIRTE